MRRTVAMALLLAAASGAAQVLAPVYAFTTNDPVIETKGLLLSSNTFYGTILWDSGGGKAGGSEGPSGSVFKLSIDGTSFTNLYLFGFPGNPFPVTNTDGATPGAQMALSGGRLYGTTAAGGFYAKGIVFAINTDGTGFTNLHNFTATVQNSDGFLTNSDGDTPYGLVLSGSTLFGTTDGGGSTGGGTVFAVQSDGSGFTNLYNFTNVESGQKTMILSGNTLYGTTEAGGSSGNGTVFALNTDGAGFTNLHSFSSTVRETTSPFLYTNSDGASPQGGLVLSGNRLYGTTRYGGTGSEGGNQQDGGTVFALNTDGTGFTNLHSFNNDDGGEPTTGLVLSGNTLYGTTPSGSSGVTANGTVFAIHTDGTGFATLDTFTEPTYEVSGVYTNAGGSRPVGNMVVSGSTLYGTTEIGGANGVGTVFALDLAVSAPTIQFAANPTNGIPPMTVQFNSPAVDSGSNAILAWSWNFGDGSNSMAQNPTHTYADTNPVTFFPTLSCINNNGSTVIGSGPAIVAAYPRSILNGGFETGTFTNWTQSGGYYSGVSTGSTYALVGTYGAALETSGTMGFLSQTLATTPGAVYLISFWLDSPRNYTVTNDFQVSWNGNVLLNKTNLAATGWTNIQLTVTAAANLSTLQFGYLNGYFFFSLDDVSVSSPPQPPGTIQFTAGPTNGILPLAVHFTSPAVDADGNTVLAWIWNFGDGSNSLAQNPSHTYTNAATFFPTLTCINSNGGTIIGSGPAIVAAYPRSILNGGFETGTFTNWTKGRDSSRVSTSSTYAHSGTYGAALEAVGTPGFLSQTLTTTPGAVYTISFWLDSPDGKTPNEFLVSWNGIILFDETNLAKIGWTNIQLTVTAAAASAAIQFAYRNDNSYFGLDDVSVAGAAPAQPGITDITVSGANLALSVTGALPNGTYYLLTSTDLAQPLSQWTPVVTNELNTNGNFTITVTNAVDRNSSQRYYILESP